MASLRPVSPALLVVLALLACGGQRSFRGGASAAAGGEDRFERAACARGEYPPALDGAAMAWARQEDLRASREALAAPVETERVAAGRASFDRRCARWIAEGSVAPGGPRSAALAAP